jgi:hypothetical protein
MDSEFFVKILSKKIYQNSFISYSDDTVELTDKHDLNYLRPRSVKLKVKAFHYNRR